MDFKKPIEEFFTELSKKRRAHSKRGHRFGWTPDKEDQRDFQFKSFFTQQPLPKKVDLRKEMSPVVNQYDIGSCTANALAACLEYIQLKQQKVAGIQIHEFDEKHFYNLSRLFVYYNTRSLIGMEMEDSGGYLRDGIKSLAYKGACREILWPYTRTLLFRKPDEDAYNEAFKNRISDYARIKSLKEMKQALANGFPFVFGFIVYEGFESDEVYRTGIMKMPRLFERSLGGHAVCAVGYDDDFVFPDKRKGAMIIRNSWGEEFGDKGHFYMPYDFISNSRYAEDFWFIRI